MGIFTANGEVLLIAKQAAAMFGNVTKRVTEAIWKMARKIPLKGIVFCMNNIEKEEKILYLPWYMVMFFKSENQDTPMIVNVDLSGL